MRSRSLLALSLLALAAVSRAADTWDLAHDFSFTSNPNGVWSYGQVNGGAFTRDASTIDVGNFRGWSGNPTTVWENVTATSQFGIGPGQISLEADGGIPDARWTAPYAGLFSISLAFGGSTTSSGGGSGNGDVDLAGLRVNGVDGTATSFVSNVKTFTINGLLLKAGDTLDAYVGARSGGGNTQTQFTVVGQPVPEPASFAALGVGALCLLRRRRKA